MSSLLQQLENNEAILLMYLAGELPEADHAEVRQMLASDPALRAALADLSVLHDDVAGVLAGADAARPLSRADVATRQVSRAMVAARLEGQRAQPAPPAKRSRLRIAWWAYPIGAAAMLTVAMTLFSGGRPTNMTSSTMPDESSIAMAPFPQGPTEIIPSTEPSNDSLAKLENEFLSLQTRGNDIELFGDGGPDVDR
jgi:hypothetical protein